MCSSSRTSAAKAGLLDLRRRMCGPYIRGVGYRLAAIEHSDRGRWTDAYVDAVADWQERQAVRPEQTVSEHLPKTAAAFPV